MRIKCQEPSSTSTTASFNESCKNDNECGFPLPRYTLQSRQHVEFLRDWRAGTRKKKSLENDSFSLLSSQ